MGEEGFGANSGSGKFPSSFMSTGYRATYVFMVQMKVKSKVK